jgi:hypothetical protein
MPFARGAPAPATDDVAQGVAGGAQVLGLMTHLLPRSGRRRRSCHAGRAPRQAESTGVTRDPDEGLDAAGLLSTGVALDRLRPAYAPVVSDCTAEVRRALGDRLHGLYLYGSVATGQARLPTSDLDLLAVSLSPVDLVVLEADLSARHADAVREVGISRVTLAEVWADDADGLGLRSPAWTSVPSCRRAARRASSPTRSMATCARLAGRGAPHWTGPGSSGAPPVASCVPRRRSSRSSTAAGRPTGRPERT